MIDPAKLGELAAMLSKTAMPVCHGRAGRRYSAAAGKKHLRAAGAPAGDRKETFAFPSGRKV